MNENIYKKLKFMGILLALFMFFISSNGHQTIYAGKNTVQLASY